MYESNDLRARSGRMWSGIPIAVCLAAVAVVGCGSNGGHSTGSLSSASSGEVALGAMGPLTGPDGPSGQGMVSGGQLAIGIINSNGGVLGKPVKLKVQDDVADPADAIPAA